MTTIASGILPGDGLDKLAPSFGFVVLVILLVLRCHACMGVDCDDGDQDPCHIDTELEVNVLLTMLDEDDNEEDIELASGFCSCCCCGGEPGEPADDTMEIKLEARHDDAASVHEIKGAVVRVDSMEEDSELSEHEVTTSSKLEEEVESCTDDIDPSS